MKKFKEYLWIAIALVALFILSMINRGSGKAGPCCPFSAKSFNQLDGGENNEY